MTTPQPPLLPTGDPLQGSFNTASDAILGTFDTQMKSVDVNEKMRWRLAQWLGLFTTLAYPVYKTLWAKEQLIKGKTIILWTLVGLTIFVVANRRVQCAEVRNPKYVKPAQ